MSFQKWRSNYSSFSLFDYQRTLVDKLVAILLWSDLVWQHREFFRGQHDLAKHRLTCDDLKVFAKALWLHLAFLGRQVEAQVSSKWVPFPYGKISEPIWISVFLMASKVKLGWPHRLHMSRDWSWCSYLHHWFKFLSTSSETDWMGTKFIVFYLWAHRFWRVSAPNDPFDRRTHS